VKVEQNLSEFGWDGFDAWVLIDDEIRKD